MSNQSNVCWCGHPPEWHEPCAACLCDKYVGTGRKSELTGVTGTLYGVTVAHQSKVGDDTPHDDDPEQCWCWESEPVRVQTCGTMPCDNPEHEVDPTPVSQTNICFACKRPYYNADIEGHTAEFHSPTPDLDQILGDFMVANTGVRVFMSFEAVDNAKQSLERWATEQVVAALEAVRTGWAVDAPDYPYMSSTIDRHIHELTKGSK